LATSAQVAPPAARGPPPPFQRLPRLGFLMPPIASSPVAGSSDLAAREQEIPDAGPLRQYGPMALERSG
jgi:hypothetical protein